MNLLYRRGSVLPAIPTSRDRSSFIPLIQSLDFSITNQIVSQKGFNLNEENAVEEIIVSPRGNLSLECISPKYIIFTPLIGVRADYDGSNSSLFYIEENYLKLYFLFIEDGDVISKILKKEDLEYEACLMQINAAYISSFDMDIKVGDFVRNKISYEVFDSEVVESLLRTTSNNMTPTSFKKSDGSYEYLTNLGSNDPTEEDLMPKVITHKDIDVKLIGDSVDYKKAVTAISLSCKYDRLEKYGFNKFGDDKSRDQINGREPMERRLVYPINCSILIETTEHGISNLELDSIKKKDKLVKDFEITFYYSEIDKKNMLFTKKAYLEEVSYNLTIDGFLTTHYRFTARGTKNGDSGVFIRTFHR